ncbi:MAG: potassium transporter TrkA [Epsilonproteobacteria bacterium]|nr:potassium transporter TrkA [Campylobacterota bacterium]
MKKVLLLIQGNEAKRFIQSIIKDYINVAEFDIVYQNDDDIKEDFKVDGISFYKIPFSDFTKLSYFKDKDYSKVIIVIKNKFFALNALKAVEFFISKNILIELVKFWDIEIQSKNINVITIPNIINSTLIDLLPNVPVFARNIGLGKEEIMEVEVPASSVFVYRNVELLNNENKQKWRIVAIYRNDKLILPNKMTTIHHYDKLVIIGQANILKDVYKSIKKDVGLFPAPYGNNIYLLIDRKTMNRLQVSKLLKSAIYLHRKLKSKKLIIKIINPNLHRFKKLDNIEGIEVYVDYHATDMYEVIMQDILKFSIGMFIIDNKFYYKNINFLLKLKKPFLKIGDEESIKKCTQSALILEDSDAITEISPLVFDISSQLEYKIKFLDIDPENVKLTKKDITIYYENISKMYYYKNVEFIVKNSNPYFEIQKMHNVCFFMPFNNKIPKNKLLSYLLPNNTNIQLLLDKYNQFMIPTK